MELVRHCFNCVSWNEIEESNAGPCGNINRTGELEPGDLPSIVGGDWFCSHTYHRYIEEVLRHTGNPDSILKPKLTGDVGYDLVVAETVEIKPHSFANVAHDVAVGLPRGRWGIILARSGTNIAGKLIVLPGVIDTGYIGQLFALMHNVSEELVKIKKGTRICQLIIIKVEKFPMVYVDHLQMTERGDGGFGSTGGNNRGAHNPNHKKE